MNDLQGEVLTTEPLPPLVDFYAEDQADDLRTINRYIEHEIVSRGGLGSPAALAFNDLALVDQLYHREELIRQKKAGFDDDTDKQAHYMKKTLIETRINDRMTTPGYIAGEIAATLLLHRLKRIDQIHPRPEGGSARNDFLTTVQQVFEKLEKNKPTIPTPPTMNRPVNP